MWLSYRDDRKNKLLRLIFIVQQEKKATGSAGMLHF